MQNAAPNGPASNRTNAYLNAILTANVVILGVVALNSVSGTGDRTANAQVAHAAPESEDAAGRTSAAEQRKAMISELRTISQRLERVEGQMAKGLSVKVTSMPPIPGLEDAMRDSGSKDAPKPAKNEKNPSSTIRPATGGSK